MKIIKIGCLFIALLGLITACTSSSGSGGGSTANGSADGGTSPLTYNENDLAGTWRWNADRQTGTLNLTGTFTFNNHVKLIDMETDRCPGQQDFSTAQFWMEPSGYVKGNMQAFCNYPGSEMKFSMNFVPGTSSKTISGLMDIHQKDFDTGIDSYVRFDIILTKQ